MYFPTDLKQQNLFFRIGKHLIRRKFIYNLKHVLRGEPQKKKTFLFMDRSSWKLQIRCKIENKQHRCWWKFFDFRPIFRENRIFLEKNWFFPLFSSSISSYSFYARIKTKCVLECPGPPLKQQLPFFSFSIALLRKSQKTYRNEKKSKNRHFWPLFLL